jgi:hypothetical protein
VWWCGVDFVVSVVGGVVLLAQADVARIATANVACNRIFLSLISRCAVAGGARHFQQFLLPVPGT